MVLGIGVAVAVLYSGTGSTGKGTRTKVADSGCDLLLSAVPSDAVLVVSDSCNEILPAAGNSPVVMSLHYYSGKLNRLYVMQLTDPAGLTEELISSASGQGLLASQEMGLLLLSDSETLLKSSHRHLSKGISILDASGFRDARGAVKGDNILCVSNSYMDRFLPVLMSRPYSGYSGFMERLADWSVFELDRSQECTSLSGTFVHGSDASDFVTVLESMKPSESAMSEVLPSYTLFAASLPMKDLTAYVNAYESYLDSRQKLQIYLAEQKKVGTAVSPVDMLSGWKLTEVGVASFKSGSSVETVNLMHVGSPAPGTLFSGTEVTSMKGYTDRKSVV